MVNYVFTEAASSGSLTAVMDVMANSNPNQEKKLATVPRNFFPNFRLMDSTLKNALKPKPFCLSKRFHITEIMAGKFLSNCLLVIRRVI